MELINLMITMVAINVFAYLTIRLRPVFFKTKLFKPMIWNFKLSLMPIIILLITSLLYLVSMYTYAHTEMILFVYLVFVVGLILWILMLPNSGYLITELNMTHRLDDVVEVPIWYEIISVMSFALSGIINTLVNIVFLQLIFLVGVDPENITKKTFISFIITAIILNVLVAIGVYLGRQIRFNSLDVLHPKSFQFFQSTL